MGDKPVQEPNPIQCTDAFWLDSKQPASIRVTLSGWTQGPYWYMYQPPLPNGVYDVPLSTCNFFVLTTAWYYIAVEVLTSSVKVTVEEVLTPTSYLNEVSKVDPLAFTMTGSPSYASILPGDVSIDFFTEGGSLPASWDAAPLVGVPESEGYFAEEFTSIIASRRLRYSNHFDGTNVKVYME